MFETKFVSSNVAFDIQFESVVSDGGEAYDKGYTTGYGEGRETGYTEGYDEGNENGYEEGYSIGSTEGYTDGYDKGHTTGYSEGYSVGGIEAIANLPRYEGDTAIELTEGESRTLELSGRLCDSDIVVEAKASGGEVSPMDKLIDGSLTEINSNATSIRQYAFYENGRIEKVNFPQAKSISQYAFYYCGNLVSANFPNITSISGGYAFSYSGLKSLIFPNANSVGASVFYQAIYLKRLEFFKSLSIGRSAFSVCSALSALILRGDTVSTVSRSGILSSTPIESGTGYIYVPSSLVDSYKSATNWSTYANQFRALEDYTVDGTITGELDLEKMGVTL